MGYILLEKLNREDLSNAKDKLIFDINEIKNGKQMNMGALQTRWMEAIGECSEYLQKCRKAQLKGILNSEQNKKIKILEDEWKEIYRIAKEYENLLPVYNRNYPNNKLQTFKERTGKILIENIFEIFNY